MIMGSGLELGMFCTVVPLVMLDNNNNYYKLLHTIEMDPSNSTTCSYTTERIVKATLTNLPKE